LPYAGSRQMCDVVLANEWMIEVKMARFLGDNGKPDDTSLKDLLSPFEADRSALTDCTKLAMFQGHERRGIVIYGFDGPTRPLAVAIDAFELLASRAVALGPRLAAWYSGLVHPVHQGGGVFGWEVQPNSSLERASTEK